MSTDGYGGGSALRQLGPLGFVAFAFLMGYGAHVLRYPAPAPGESAFWWGLFVGAQVAIPLGVGALLAVFRRTRHLNTVLWGLGASAALCALSTAASAVLGR